MIDQQHCYQLFGLRISSDILLPELMPRPAGDGADVVIGRGAVAEDGKGIGAPTGPFSHAAEQVLWLRVPGVARYLVRDGATLTYQPETGIDEASIRVFLLGTCIGALLVQRGQLVLHGNAFAVDGTCVICVGPSGAGKSTLAARMLQRGHRIIADDVCPVDAQGRAVPGMARLKLWQHAANGLAIDTGSLQRLRPGLAKFDVPLGDAYHAEPTPIAAVYVLNPWNQDRFAIDEIEGIAKFQALRANSYRFRFLQGMALGARHLEQCAALAARLPVAEVRRPRHGFDIDGLADRILEDVARRTVAA